MGHRLSFYPGGGGRSWLKDPAQSLAVAHAEPQHGFHVRSGAVLTMLCVALARLLLMQPGNSHFSMQLLTDKMITDKSYAEKLWINVLLGKEKRQACLLVFLCWQIPIFPGRLQPSIFGTSELNFRVRNGNGWTLTVNNTNSRLFRRALCPEPQISASSSITHHARLCNPIYSDRRSLCGSCFLPRKFW